MLRWRSSWSSRFPELRLHRHDLEVVLQALEVPGVAGVQPSVVHMGGRGDEQVHDAKAGLAAGLGHHRREHAVADRHRVVDGQRFKAVL